MHHKIWLYMGTAQDGYWGREDSASFLERTT